VLYLHGFHKHEIITIVTNLSFMFTILQDCFLQAGSSFIKYGRRLNVVNESEDIERG